jgi:hypothetical protein
MSRAHRRSVSVVSLGSDPPELAQQRPSQASLTTRKLITTRSWHAEREILTRRSRRVLAPWSAAPTRLGKAGASGDGCGARRRSDRSRCATRRRRRRNGSGDARKRPAVDRVLRRSPCVRARVGSMCAGRRPRRKAGGPHLLACCAQDRVPVNRQSALTSRTSQMSVSRKCCSVCWRPTSPTLSRRPARRRVTGSPPISVALWPGAGESQPPPMSGTGRPAVRSLS